MPLAAYDCVWVCSAVERKKSNISTEHRAAAAPSTHVVVVEVLHALSLSHTTLSLSVCVSSSECVFVWRDTKEYYIIAMAATVVTYSISIQLYTFSETHVQFCFVRCFFRFLSLHVHTCGTGRANASFVCTEHNTTKRLSYIYICCSQLCRALWVNKIEYPLHQQQPNNLNVSPPKYY